MSRVQQYQAGFTTGELDPLLRGRIDLEQYYSSVATADNVLFEPQGGVSRRPGTKFCFDATADNAANGTILIPFEFSTTQNLMILASAYNTASTIRFRFFINGVVQTNINGSGNDYLDRATGTLYSVSAFDISKLYFTQNMDTLIFTHENFVPFKLTRGANNSTWTLTTIDFTTAPEKNAPYYVFTESISQPSATLTPSAVLGSITLTASAGVFSSITNQRIRAKTGFGIAKIISLQSSTVANAIVEVPFMSTDAIASGDWDLVTGWEPAFSATRGWPRTCTFHEGRLYFGGTAHLPATLFGSKISDFYNFSQAEALDDDAIMVTLNTDSVNAITAMRSGRDLQIFTTGGEFFIPQSNLDPITPANIVVKSTTRRGSKPGIRPQAAEGGTLFIQRQGKALREMIFSDTEISYVANNISLLSSHLIVDPQGMALRAATDTTEGDLLLIVNGTDSSGYRAASTGFTGTLAAFMLNRGQQIVAPSTWTTDGDFVDVGVDIDQIYTVVKRTIGGAAKYYVEVFDDDRTTDSAIQYYTSPVSPDQAKPSNTTAGGLAHLNGEVVKVIRDDIVDADFTVSGGNATLGGVPSVYAEVGLNYTITLTTNPFEPRLPSGTVASQKRRVLEVTPRLYRSQNITINSRTIPLQTLPISGLGKVPTFTGLKKTKGFLGYSTDAQITISQDQPVFFTVLALDYKVSI